MANLLKGHGPLLWAAVSLAGVALLAGLALAGPGSPGGREQEPTPEATITPRIQVSQPSVQTQTATFALG